jgi:pimeloyl-ACP methyl ester carboxylesterase
VVGLVHILGYEQAVIAGQDLGALVAQNAAILRPDIFRAVILLSVPYGSRTEGAVKPTEAIRKRAPEGQQFYQTYFQMPGVAEKELDADPKRTLCMFLYSLQTRCGSRSAHETSQFPGHRQPRSYSSV